MKRFFEQSLVNWKNSQQRIPLIVRGARQVGKTYTIEHFAKTHFSTSLSINFEFQPEYANCFNFLDPFEIIKQIEIISGQKIEIGKTLVFLDEVQECPKAILALRYFKEKMPNLHIIAAGSLLDLILNKTNFRMPVGRVQFLYMYPINFVEFLLALGEANLVDYLQELKANSIIPEAIHQKALKLFKEYIFVGGMPAVIKAYIASKSYISAQEQQLILLNGYRSDFPKYSTIMDIKYIETVFDKISSIVSKPITYVDISRDYQARDIKRAINLLEEARIIKKNMLNNASGIPIKSGEKEKYKIIFLDIGLYLCALGLDYRILLEENDLTLVNHGTLTEQVVGQELLSYQGSMQEGYLCFWERNKKNSSAEVDYLFQSHDQILPIEVKSGKTGRLKSMKLYLEETQVPLGIRISQKKLSLEGNIFSVPFYLIREIPKLAKKLLS